MMSFLLYLIYTFFSFIIKYNHLIWNIKLNNKYKIIKLYDKK